MADYTGQFNIFDDKFIASSSFVAIGGDGLSSSNPLVLNPGDRLRFQINYNNSGGSNGSQVTFSSWSSSVWTATSNQTISGDNSFTAYRTVGTGTNGNTDAIQSAWVGSGNDFFYVEVAGTSSDTEVDSLSFGANVTGANLGAITYRSDQITGINQAVTFSKTSGDSGFEWQVTSSATTPTSGWGTASVSVSNNQYVHLKMTASSSYSTARSATFSIGDPAKTDTISITTKATPSPSAFDLGDTSGAVAGGSYNSNTITLAGLDSGQSVTVSISSNSSTYGYYKNGTLVANAANTTGVNGDQFYVSHVANTGASAVTSTSLTAGGTSDTFTTTNGNASGTIWAVSKGSPSGTPNEGDLIGMSINAPLGQNENFWWSVSPTDVDASTGSGTTSYNPATKGVPAYNIGGFTFTPNIDYTDDAAAGTGPYDYTVNVYDDSGRTNLVATTTVAVNDSSQPLPPDSVINAIGNQTLEYAAGSNNGHSITIGGADDDNSYYDVVVDGTTTPVYGTEIGNGTLEVADDNISPGNQTTFRVYARRPVANNGDNSYYNTNQTYTISRRAQTPSISAALASNPNDDDVTINWTISNGDGGTLQYSTDNTNWTNGTSFAQGAKRGTEYTLYARTNATVVSTTATANFTPGYNDPDASIDAITSPDQPYGSTTYVVPIANGSSIDEYYVYNNAGTVSYGGRTGDGNITITHGVAAGGAATFRVYARRPVLVGGNNNFFDTETTFEVEVYPNAPSISASDDNAEATSVLVTLSATGGEGGTIEYAKFSYSATTEYEQNRNTTVTYYARSRGPNGLLSTVSSINYYVGYIDPDASIDAITSPDQPYGNTTYVVTIGNGYASDEYFVYNNAGTVSYGGRTGDGNITITHGVAAGGAATFRVYARKPLAVGGDNGFDDTGTTFEVEVYPQTPTATVTFNNPDDDDVTATITAGNGDGANTITYSVNGTDFSTDNTRPAVRGTSFTGYVRNTGVNGLTATASDTETPGFISPDLNISLGEGSAFTIGVSDTNFILTIQDGNSNDRYQVRDSSSTAHESRLGNGAITVTDLPAGGSETYTIFGKRPTGTGGTDTYSTTGTSVTVTQEAGAGIVPPVIQSITNDNPNSSNVTATVNLTSPGSGGTLQYAQTTSNSVPSSGWQSGNTFSHPRNTTRYYWASQSTNTAGAYDSQSHFVANYTPDIYGIQIFNASGNLTLDISDRVSGIVSRGSFNVTTGTTNVGGQIPQYEGTSTPITFQGMDPDNEEEFEVWISGDIPTAQFGLTNFTINRGTNSYTVTYRSYTASQTISVPYFNVRY